MNIFVYSIRIEKVMNKNVCYLCNFFPKLITHVDENSATRVARGGIEKFRGHSGVEPENERSRVYVSLKPPSELFSIGPWEALEVRCGRWICFSRAESTRERDLAPHSTT